MNRRIRYDGSSGGMVTEILLYLLERNLIQAAVITRMKKNQPFEAEAYIARDRNDIISGQGSKYCPVSNCFLFKEIGQSTGKYAFVGLPCQMAALRKAQRLNKKLIENIPFALGLFCSRTPNSHATRFLIDSIGIRRDKVKRIRYRGGGHPGRFEVALSDGSTKSIGHLDNRYWGFTFLYFFKPLRCWLCHDHSAELADWSFADNWSKNSLERSHKIGTSVVVARTENSAQIIQQMRDGGMIKTEEVSPASVIRQQELIKKSNVSSRLWVVDKAGKKIPELSPLTNKRKKIFDFIKASMDYFHILLFNRQYNYKQFNLLIRIYRIFYMLSKLFKLGYKAIAKLIQIFSIKKGVPYNRKSKYKIMIIGGFGYQDIGDEAMPRADIINLRSLITDLEIVMASPDPDYTKSYHRERSIQDITDISCGRNSSLLKKIRVNLLRSVFLLGCFLEKYKLRLGLWPSARDFLDELSNCDVLFNVGGGNLTSVIPLELYKKGAIYLGAKILNKQIILSGQTIGPFNGFFDRIWSRLCLNCADLITMRDKHTSAKRVEEIGVTKPVILDAADDAMTLPVLHKKESKKILISEVGESWLDLPADLSIAMNLKASLSLFKGHKRSNTLKNEIEIMAHMADKLIELKNAKIFFIPTDYNIHTDDRKLHRQIVALMTHKNNTACIEGEYDDITLKGLIATSDAAIGARYHFCVFAASCSVPFLGLASGIYQQTKLKGLADLAKLPKCFIGDDLEYADFNVIWPRIESFIDSRDKIRQVLLKNTPTLSAKSLIGVQTASSFMNAIQQSRTYA